MKVLKIISFFPVMVILYIAVAIVVSVCVLLSPIMWPVYEKEYFTDLIPYLVNIPGEIYNYVIDEV